MISGIFDSFSFMQSDIIGLLEDAEYCSVQETGTETHCNPSSYDPRNIADSKQLVEIFLSKRLRVVRGEQLVKAHFVSQNHIECTTQDFLTYIRKLMNNKSWLFHKIVDLQALLIDAVEVVADGIVRIFEQQNNFAGIKSELICRITGSDFERLQKSSPEPRSRILQDCYLKLVDMVVNLEPMDAKRDSLLFARYTLKCVRLIKKILAPNDKSTCLCYTATQYSDIATPYALTDLTALRPTRFFFIEVGYSVKSLTRHFEHFVEQANAVHLSRYKQYSDMNTMMVLMYAYIERCMSHLHNPNDINPKHVYAELQSFLSQNKDLLQCQEWIYFIKQTACLN